MFHVEQRGRGWGKKVSAICEKHLQRKKADDIIMSKPHSGTRRGEDLSGKRTGAGFSDSDCFPVSAKHNQGSGGARHGRKKRNKQDGKMDFFCKSERRGR